MPTDLELYFRNLSAGRKTPAYFSDRTDHVTAFHRSLRNFESKINATNEAILRDGAITLPRNNIMHLFGVGGIGKTEILRKLKASYLQEADAPVHWPKFVSRKQPIVCFFDFGIASNTSIEEFLLTLRASFSDLGRLTAFDLLLLKYWATNHPEKQLSNYISTNSRYAKARETFGLDAQLNTTIGQITNSLIEEGLSISGASILGVFKKGYKAISENAKLSKLVGSCPNYEQIYKAPSTERSLPFFALALAWDLAEAAKTKNYTTVCFIDHIHCLPEWAETQLQQIVWALPNTLFISAGVQRLNWAETNPITPLYNCGPDVWPGLSLSQNNEPKQHCKHPNF